MQGYWLGVDAKMPVDTRLQIKNNLVGTQNQINMSSVMPFAFNAAKLYVVAINKKTSTSDREICKALECGKATKASDIVKHLCSRENYAHKYHLNEFVFEANLMDWPKDSKMKRGCMRWYFQDNNQRQKTSGNTAAMYCFLMPSSSLQTK